MTMNPLVSVIIPTYNGERYILQAVKSVLSQTYKNYEIIVIDDGSTDNTKQVLQPYQHLIRYIYQKNQGAAIARNHGCRIAKGEFLAFLDGDDFWEPQKLEQQITYFAENPDIDLVQSGWNLVNQNGEIISKITPWDYAPELDLATWVIYKLVRPSALILRRHWWEKVGGFDHRYPPTEDLDFVLRLALMGCKSAWLTEIHAAYRQHENNLMSGGIKVMQNTEILMEHFFAKPDLPPEIRALKPRERYECFVWLGWRMYRDGFMQEMVESLQKSLPYSPFVLTETVAHWLETFKRCSAEYNHHFDVYSISKLPEWQDLMFTVMNYPLAETAKTQLEPLKATQKKSSTLRILLCNTDESGWGGLAQYDHAMVCKLAKLGYRVSVARPRQTNPLIAKEKELGIEQIWLDYNGNSDFSRVLKSREDAEELFAKTRPDLIIFSDGWPLANFAAKIVAMQQGIPYMTALGLAQPEHATFTQGDGTDYVAIMPLISMQAKAVITAAQEHLNILHKYFKVPQEKGKVIYYGRNEKYFAPPNLEARKRLRQEIGIPDDGVICFTSARLAAVKGHCYQLDAIKLLKNSPIFSQLYFVWAGTGAGSYDDVEGELKAKVEELGVRDRVIFLGQRWDIIDWLDAIDIFVLTSLAEAAPSFAIMEAMAKGLPIVASAAGGIPEGLGETGKLLPDPNKNPEETAKELAKTLEEWVINPSLRESIGKACKKRAETLFKEERMLEESIAVIQEILSPENEGDKLVKQLEIQGEMQKYEKTLQYSHLVWKAWQSYCQGETKEMINLLSESVNYTPFLGTETILNWLASFAKFAEESKKPCDIYQLTNSPEWKELIDSMLGVAIA